MLEKIKHELNYLKREDIGQVFVFILSILPAIIYKIYVKCNNKRIWLVCEDPMEARDNGFCFFKYINNTETEVISYYAINYKSSDYGKVSNVGKTVRYGSIRHWIYYFSCEFNISSQKAGKPNAAVGYVLDMLGLTGNKFVFLQHGITINKAKWLFFDNTKIRLFICGARPEYEYVKKYFGYPDNNVIYTGFCRFDDYHNINIDKKSILLMPSWREWIGSRNEYSKLYENSGRFIDTQYYKTYQSLINNVRLIKYLEEKGVTLYFYPHRNMQQYIENFTTVSGRIQIISNKNSDIRQLLIKTCLMITDYSSVALDYAYMKKPVIYYQFDADRFFEAQYERGYYLYEEVGLGEVAYKEDEVIDYIIKEVDSDYALSERFDYAHKNFFEVFDNRNCERIYNALCRMEK